ncbi:MAG: hypothetical protein KDD03_02590, partial [Gelidibacter sp.]|nr:hypothetical protein [Gelidibacter sp.]
MSETTFNSDLIKAVYQDEITIRFCYCKSTGQYEIVTERGIEVLSAKYEKYYNQAEQLFADEITHRFGYHPESHIRTNCDKPCSPADFYKGGYCDKKGCYQSRSDRFREGLENLSHSQKLF